MKDYEDTEERIKPQIGDVITENYDGLDIPNKWSRISEEVRDRDSQRTTNWNIGIFT